MTQEQMMDQFKTVFFEECIDLLSSSERHLSCLDSNDFTKEDIHAIFRAVHSVKGGAGTFGFDELVIFAHVFETSLDILRSHAIEITQDLVDLLLRANDILSALVHNAQTHSTDSPSQQEHVLIQLQNFIEKYAVEENTPLKNKTIQEKKNDLQKYAVEFIPKLDMMRFGNEPFFILRELKKLAGEQNFKITSHTSRIPLLHEYNPENCYLSWSIEMETEAPESDIFECFEFVEDDAEITISPLNEFQDICKKTLLESPKKEDPSQKESTVETVNSIRVELDRIDKLVNTVGEMVIKQAMLLDRAHIVQDESSGRFDDFIKALSELTQHTRELQESVMSIRAQPVKAVFARIPRLVRELSTQLGKNIRVEMSGENTEIDKTVIERLGEPLTHMIRNAVDHGIESPEKRIALGKNPMGKINLSAEHKSGRIVIQLKDDGAGIPRERVLQKAKAQGIVLEDAQLSGEEIDQLIFHPGFSTAAEITNISGRGVGMDVVKKSIQALGGRINIQSEEGKGCTFNLLLPLTLAVLDGMIVRVGEESYVIPLIHIIETLRPNLKQIHSVIGGCDILDLRSKNIPLIYVHKLFEVPNAIHNPSNGIVVVVETENDEYIGLVVDELLSQQQVVLKSLEANTSAILGISAATILGNGRVSLILDVNAIQSIKIQHKENDYGKPSFATA